MMIWAYEPFKTLLLEVEVECQLKEIQGVTIKTPPGCAYARSDDRWMWQRRTMKRIAGGLVRLA